MFTGLKELGELLLSKFKWGHGFFSLNEGLLDAYAACRTAADVVQAQQEYLQQAAEKDAQERLRGGGNNYRFHVMINS